MMQRNMTGGRPVSQGAQSNVHATDLRSRVPKGVPSPVPVHSRERPLGTPAFFLVTLWCLVLFDVQWLFASYGLQPVLKLPTLLFFLLIGTLMLQVPGQPVWRSKWQWHGPFLLFVASAAVTLPWALNNGYARQSIQLYMLYWTLIVATLVMVDSVRRAERLFLLYGISFLWWGVWGAWRGSVPWHYSLFNTDGFGALMVSGVGMSAFLTAAAPKKSTFRRTMAVATSLCMIGVVASFARGAFLAAVAVAVLIWLRSKRKWRGLLIGVGGAILVIGAANILHPGEFWVEIESAFSHGTDEGTNQDRWILWGAAWDIFKERPWFGVGPRNFGPFASQFFEVGDLPEGGYGYTNNPGMLYNRSLHNIYIQILCEQGIVGTLAFLLILVHFWRRNAALRSEDASRLWRGMGGRLQLRALASGLEAGMVGFLVPSVFYGLITVHWFYTMIALNLLLHSMVFGNRNGKSRRGGSRGMGGSAPSTAARFAGR